MRLAEPQSRVDERLVNKTAEKGASMAISQNTSIELEFRTIDALKIRTAEALGFLVEAVEPRARMPAPDFIM